MALTNAGDSISNLNNNRSSSNSNSDQQDQNNNYSSGGQVEFDLINKLSLFRADESNPSEDDESVSGKSNNSKFKLLKNKNKTLAMAMGHTNNVLEVLEIHPSAPDPGSLDSDRNIKNLLEIPMKRNVISWKEKEEFTFSWTVSSSSSSRSKHGSPTGNENHNPETATLTSLTTQPLAISSPSFKPKSAFISDSKWSLQLRAKPADGCYSVYLSLDHLDMGNFEPFFYLGFDFRIVHAQHPVRWRRSGLCKVDGETWAWGYKNLISVDELKSRYPLTITLTLWLMKNVFEGHCNMSTIHQKLSLQDEEDATQEELAKLWNEREVTWDIKFLCGQAEPGEERPAFIYAPNSENSNSDSNQIIFKAHRLVLQERCPLLLKFLDLDKLAKDQELERSSNNNEAAFSVDDNSSEVLPIASLRDSEEIEPEIMTAFLEYIYLATLPPECDDGFKTPAKLLKMAHTFGLKSLTEKCFCMLSRKLTCQNVLSLIALAEDYDGSDMLRQKLHNYCHLHEEALEKLKILQSLRRRSSEFYRKIFGKHNPINEECIS